MSDPSFRLDIDRLAAKMAAPFRISGYVFDAMPAVLATISADGASGRGEAAGVYYLGDDQDRMVEQIETVRAAVEGGIDRPTLQVLLPPGGARNALDCALWELEARRSGVPVWRLAGAPEPKPRLTTFTLSADEPQIFERKLGELHSTRAIKLKLEGDIDADRERLSMVRSRYPDSWLMADANQGFGAKDFDALESILVEHRVALLEQPVPRGDEASLEGWRTPFPIAADESILTLAELNERGRYFDMINIKLDKCGGLTEALAIAKVSLAMGKSLMVGNMAGGTLAMAPAFIVAQYCDVVDLDGPAGLADDAHVDEIYSDGEIFVPETLWGAG
ncbi:dipeptide epimerase [Sphingomonas sp.]|uniref:dipeptide epimerase n=1 Tax=Sphingomonas sp. TaxID=28214 RepID=UPI0025D29D31|nr:dipeptide epimerase [Sphingomonas sp.]MBV9528728.1 dipeptide epimerase [Sphingomonas sp.]